MSRRTARASASTARLVARLALDPDLLLGMLRSRRGYSRRDLWDGDQTQASSKPEETAQFNQTRLATDPEMRLLEPHKRPQVFASRGGATPKSGVDRG